MKHNRNAPRMADVAKAAGVSTMTVSRAFRDETTVSAKRRAEILRIAEEIGYIFDKSASELRTKRTGFVAVTVPSINNPNFADSVRGLTDALTQRGLEVLLGFTDYRLENEERIIRQMLRRKPEALVVTGSTHTAAVHQALATASIPVVETWDEPEDPVDYSVGFSNADAGYMMAQHLISAGYRKIAFVGCDPEIDVRGHARQMGFAAGLQQAGLDATRIITIGQPPIFAQSGAEAAQMIQKTRPDTDAIMCVADSVAYGAITEFQRMGWAVPHDIAVAGFGAYDVSAFNNPPITTIDPSAYRIGELAGSMIGSLLNGDGGAQTMAKHAHTEPRLIVRASTRR